MNITAFNKNNSYVVTFSSNKIVQTHDRLVSGIGSPSIHSSYVSKRRAFNRASAIIYCNQHILTTFVTLTYKHQHDDYKTIINDLKNLFSRRKIEYIAVVEKHKSGMYHVHAITSDLPNIVSLRKGKYSCADWHKGFSDVKFISGTDEKFRIEKYLFKYMQKGEKIGGRYFLKSRNLTVKKYSYKFGDVPKPIMQNWPIDIKEKFLYNVDNINVIIEREYYDGKHRYPSQI